VKPDENADQSAENDENEAMDVEDTKKVESAPKFDLNRDDTLAHKEVEKGNKEKSKKKKGKHKKKKIMMDIDENKKLEQDKEEEQKSEQQEQKEEKKRRRKRRRKRRTKRTKRGTKRRTKGRTKGRRTQRRRTKSRKTRTIGRRRKTDTVKEIQNFKEEKQKEQSRF